MESKTAGDAAFRAGDWRRAFDLYTESLGKSQTPEAFANRAACALHLEDFGSAERDCEAGLALQPRPPLAVKMWWRLAVALRMQGHDRAAWEAAVAAGLDLDAANAKLLDEQKFVFVESQVPPEFMETQAQSLSVTQSQKPSQSQSQSPSQSQSQSQKPESEFIPRLPLTYTGVLQLVRSNSPEAHKFLYEHVSGADLQAALAKAGVEPQVLDFFNAMFRANTNEKNAEFLAALRASPRYDMAVLMAD